MSPRLDLLTMLSVGSVIGAPLLWAAWSAEDAAHSTECSRDCAESTGAADRLPTWGLTFEEWPDTATLRDAYTRPPAPTCGLPIGAVIIEAALPDPVHAPDRVGESVRLSSRWPVPIDLSGWGLWTRSRHKIFGHLALSAGAAGAAGAVVIGGDSAAARLGPVALANRGGRLDLRDGCGTTIASICWAPPEEEEDAVAPATWFTIGLPLPAADGRCPPNDKRRLTVK